MKLDNILTALRGLSDSELLTLNREVCSQLKTTRDRSSAAKRHLFKAGDKVHWNGRGGFTEGIIVRVKRKKAIVNTGDVRLWDVPISMLEAS